MQVLLSEMQKNCSKCHWVPGRRLLYLGPQNLHVGPPFSPVGRAVYYFTLSLFYSFNYYFTILLFHFPLGSRQEVFASRAAKPACRTAFSPAGPFTVLLFHIHWVPGKRFLHLGLPILHVRRRSFVASRAANPACRLTFFACRAANPTRPPHPSISQSFFASRTANPACRLTFLHVGQTYP